MDFLNFLIARSFDYLFEFARKTHLSLIFALNDISIPQLYNFTENFRILRSQFFVLEIDFFYLITKYCFLYRKTRCLIYLSFIVSINPKSLYSESRKTTSENVQNLSRSWKTKVALFYIFSQQQFVVSVS